jgi:hypothetical protein
MSEEREVRTVRTVRMADLVDALRAAGIHAATCRERELRHQMITTPSSCDCWVDGNVDLRLIVNG